VIEERISPSQSEPDVEKKNPKAPTRKTASMNQGKSKAQTKRASVKEAKKGQRSVLANYYLEFKDGNKKTKRIPIDPGLALSSSRIAREVLWNMDYRTKPPKACREYAKVAAGGKKSVVCVEDANSVSSTRMVLNRLYNVASR
jgi:hypothetical protein